MPKIFQQYRQLMNSHIDSNGKKPGLLGRAGCLVAALGGVNIKEVIKPESVQPRLIKTAE